VGGVSDLEDLVDIVEVIRREPHGKVEKRHLQVENARQVDVCSHATDVPVENVEHVNVWGDALWGVLCKRCEAIHEGNENGLDVDPRLELAACLQDLVECAKVKLIGKDLVWHRNEVFLKGFGV
jgi:hypothetical protein